MKAGKHTGRAVVLQAIAGLLAFACAWSTAQTAERPA